MITPTVSPKDVVFIQRSTDNTKYGEIHVSGSNVIPYIDINGNLTADTSSSFYMTFPVKTVGASGTFTTVDLKTVTVSNGIITSIV